MRARISRRVEAYGPRPECDGENALENLLKSKDLYSAAPTPVRPYGPHKLRCSPAASWRLLYEIVFRPMAAS